MTDDLKKYYNFVKDDVVYIHGEFDEGISKHVIPEFKALINNRLKMKNCGRIVIDICSNGGYIYILSELLALIEIAKEGGIIIETRAMSTAHSCGSILLAAGTVGHRIGSPMTQVLVHHVNIYTQSATDKQLDREYVKAKHLNEMMKGLLKRYTKIPTKTLTEMLDDDSYYVYGEDLIKFGIIDKLAYEV